jgi:NAD-dependent deacetylase
MDEKISKLKEIVDKSNSIVFFGGAGVSTESGLPDFRGGNGIYKKQYPYPAEHMLSHSFFISNPAEFFDFYVNNMVFPHAKPNAAHEALAKLEKYGRLKAVITQNIDGLHQMAGSENVIELHGSVFRNFCMDCGKAYPLEYVVENKPVPTCSCGGIVKPDVVLYEEGLDSKTLSAAARLIKNADTVIIGGTSLSVYPAAGLLSYFEGDNLVVINKTKTQADRVASLVINASIGEVLGSITN